MNRKTWAKAMEALVLVRIGQELGTQSPAAKAVHDTIEIALFWARFFVLDQF